MSHAEKVVSKIIQIEIHRCKQNPRLMPGIDIASSCSSLLTPAEEYLGYPSYGEHIGSNGFDLFDAADDTLLAHQHGACSWALGGWKQAGLFAKASASTAGVSGGAHPCTSNGEPVYKSEDQTGNRDGCTGGVLLAGSYPVRKYTPLGYANWARQ